LKNQSHGVYSFDQFLTLYTSAFVFALGASIATPVIPVFAKSFDTGFGVASLRTRTSFPYTEPFAAITRDKRDLPRYPT